MKTTPDMTMKQFNAALARNGMKRVPFMGYIDLGIPGHSLEIHPLYGCMRLRDQLAYGKSSLQKTRRVPQNHALPN